MTLDCGKLTAMWKNAENPTRFRRKATYNLMQTAGFPRLWWFEDKFPIVCECVLTPSLDIFGLSGKIAQKRTELKR